MTTELNLVKKLEKELADLSIGDDGGTGGEAPPNDPGREGGKDTVGGRG